jgi:flavin-dependent dehydrogenase
MDRSLALSSRVSATRGELLFCDDLAGYGWCLRKGNYLNIGLGRETTAGLSDDLQRLLRWLVSTQRVPLQQWPRFRGHAYLAYTRSRRPLSADGCLLVGDAAGMACERSGEGIRPAVESALLAALAVGKARGDYRAAGLAPFARLVEARFGPRQHHALPTAPPRRTPRWRSTAGRWLVSTEPFLRHVVLDRFFLQRAAAALHPVAGSLNSENFS